MFSLVFTPLSGEGGNYKIYSGNVFFAAAANVCAFLFVTQTIQTARAHLDSYHEPPTHS